MKISDAVLPPASGLWVGEVREGCWARPNLPYQYVSCGIFNKDVSFQSIIKRRVSSRRAGAADPRVLTQKQESATQSQVKRVLLPPTAHLETARSGRGAL